MNTESQQPAPLPSKFARDEDLMSLLGIYLDQLRESLAGIDAALKAEDVAELGRLGHKAKGSSDTYGYPDLARQFAALEEAAARQAPLSELRLYVKLLKRLAERVELGAQVRH